MKIVFGSDFHLGLKTFELDRTSEIISLLFQIVRHAAKLKEYGEEVILILGGDIFNTNVPSEAHITQFIRVMNMIKKYDLKTFVMVGNHDAVADPNRLSCLNFIKETKPGYNNIHLIEDIKFMKIPMEIGELNLVFLPHISRATLHNKIVEKKLKPETTTQEYIEGKCARILKKAGGGVPIYAFSHLNVHGAHGGSEENLLKKSEVFLPKCMTTDVALGTCIPTIIQAHIHSREKIGNINIVGSQLYCGFGESEAAKYFLEIDIKMQLGKGEDELNYIPANCTKFLELELDMIKQTKDFLTLPEVKEFLKTITKGAVVRFDILISAENNHYDWNSIAKTIKDKYECHVKPIIPRVVLKRPIRSVQQKLGLDPKDAVKIYLTKNMIKDKQRAKRVYGLALKYL
jgi:DNA repair exonuclease SbcCD nuclease subunit